MKTRTIQNLAAHLLFVVVLFVFAFPFIWLILTSFKAPSEATLNPPVILFWPTLSNYEYVIYGTGFFTFLQNSVVASVGSLLVSMLLALPAAYALARLKMRHKIGMLNWYLSTRMTPLVGVVIPFFIEMRELALLDTLQGLILIYTAIDIPLIIWMMVTFLQDLPVEIEEAALIDGCSRFQAFTRITLRLAAPGLVAAAVLCIIMTWNEFFFALILTTYRAATLPLSIISYQTTSTGIVWTQMAAAEILIMLPVVIFGWLAQKYLVRGLTFGAVKG